MAFDCFVSIDIVLCIHVEIPIQTCSRINRIVSCKRRLLVNRLCTISLMCMP